MYIPPSDFLIEILHITEIFKESVAVVPEKGTGNGKSYTLKGRSSGYVKKNPPKN